MTFEEIVADQVEGIVIAYDPALGEVEECLRCEQCGRLVRARPTAWQLHQKLTCGLYQEAGQ